VTDEDHDRPVTDPGPGDPGRLLAEGRSARVYLIEDGWLLRRFRDQRQDVTTEATVLRWAARHGVPVPAVREAAGPDLVIEHVHGPSMLTALLDDPSSGSGYGRTLAELHRRLDGVPAPPELPTPTGEAGRLLHGDLHPGNVLLTGHGPVLIDWTNAASGPSAHDTATTWLVLACLEHSDPQVGSRLAAVRPSILDGFLSGIDRSAAAAAMPQVAAGRIADPATTDSERARIGMLVDEISP
jgi:aminoglycoside phosphotransferase (APT) family kinase protein